MRSIAIAIFAMLTLTTGVASAQSDPVGLVNPLVGTTYGGDTFPGPDVPFGMIQWGPDTTTRPAGGGYEYMDSAITGFSLTHLSGPGCPVLNDVGILPYVGQITDPQHASMPFSHVQEHSQPGWYHVLLGDDMNLDVSLTSTTRSALGAFRFPADQQAHVLFNMGHSGTTVADARIALVGNRGVEGYVRAGGFCGMPGHYNVFFSGEFDTPFETHGTWNGSALHGGDSVANGPDSGAWVDFGMEHRTVKFRVAISYVDLAGARRNLAAEATTWDLASQRARAQSAWRQRLSQAQIRGGTDAEEHSFWTAFYHAMLHPNVMSDIDGRYPGFDGNVHRVAPGHLEYGTWSGWDVYRTQLQLLGFLFPHEASDMVRSLLDANDQMGWLPRWSLLNDETGVMNGDPGPSLIADAYFFGARDFDRRKALAAMVHGATANDTPPGQGWYEERNNVAQYQSLGYVDSTAQNSVSHVPNGASETLEYSTSDFAIAAFARDLHETATYRRFLARSGNWERLFNRATDAIEPRDARGDFVVAPATGEGQIGFQEGSAEQYTWAIPQDQSGLVRDFGGDAKALPYLDRFFAVLPEHDGDWSTPYIGLNNEPSFGAPFMYLSAHAPWRTQEIVRLIETKYFDNAPGGEPGNDDLGAMSAMYLWESTGLYPQTPGTNTLDIASPLFTHVRLRSEDGRSIVVDAPAARTDAPYVWGVRVNGKPSGKTWIAVPNHGDVRLTFDLRASRGTWGSRPGDEPPSFDGGVRPPNGISTVGAPAASRGPLSPSELQRATFVVTYFDGTIVPIDDTGATATGFTLNLRVPDARLVDGGRVAALAAIYDNSVSFVDLATRAVAERVKVGNQPAGLAPSPDARTLWVANRGDDTVAPIDVATKSLGDAVKVGTRPVALQVSADGTHLYVLDQGANAVSVVDIPTRREVARIAVGEAPDAMALSGGLIYVANMFSNDVSIVDPASGKEIARVATGVSPRSIVAFRGRVYVANWGSSTIDVLDAKTGRNLATLRTGENPAALALAADGKLYIALSGENAYQTLDVNSHVLSVPVHTPGSSPRTIIAR